MHSSCSQYFEAATQDALRIKQSKIGRAARMPTRRLDMKSNKERLMSPEIFSLK